MPNIYDVARRARVSAATVSAVLNESAFVSPGLKARVQAAVATLGYEPNLLARGLAKRQTKTIGMIVPDIANPFFPEVVRGAEDTVQTAGYTLLIASTDNDVEKEKLYLRLFLAKRVDGVILTKAPGRFPPDLQRAFARAGVPIVLLARTVPGFATDTVEMDDRGAAYEGVMHLRRLGYRRIVPTQQEELRLRWPHRLPDLADKSGLDLMPEAAPGSGLPRKTQRSDHDVSRDRGTELF